MDINEEYFRYKNKSVLITGGAGFIGSNLASVLVNLGAKVTLVDNMNPSYGGNQFNISNIRSSLIFNISDIRDEKIMRAKIKGADFLFNLAAQTSHVESMTNPLEDLSINTVGPLTILELCRQINPSIKIIFSSTRQIYGKPDYVPVKETHPIRPVDINGINKYASESYHLMYQHLYGIRSTVLRLTNTYGAGMRIKDARQTFLGIWIRNILEGNPINVFGDGTQIRDFNYVDDCVCAMLLAGLSEGANGKVYNLGGDEIISLRDLAELVIKIAGYGKYEIIDFPAERSAIDIGSIYGDYSLISNELGWKPRVSLAVGLTKTIEYYHSNLSEYTKS